MRYALIDENGNVVNCIEWDGLAPYVPAGGMTLRQSDTAGIGYSYANGVFTPPPPPPLPPDNTTTAG